MFQLNAPKKIVSTAHFWSSVLLVVLALVFSFMPIISLDLSMPEVTIGDDGEISYDKGQADYLEAVGDLMQEMGIYVEIPEKVDVSLPKLIGSVSMIFKVVAAAGEGEDAAEKQAELDEYLETENGKQDVVTAIAIAASFMKAFDFESLSGENANIMSFLLNTLLSMVGLFAVLALVVIIPLKLIIAGIKTLITVARVLKNKENPELYCATVAGILPSKITLVFTLMLFQCVLPGMTYGWGVLTICILGIVSVVLNFATTRVRRYPDDQFVYLNVVQGGALVGMIGFIVFFFNIVKSGIIKSFVGGGLSDFLTNVIGQAVENGGEVSVNNAYIVDIIMMFVYLVIMLYCTKYFDKTAKRFSCTVKKGLISNKPKDSGIVGACILFLAYLLPTLVAGFKHNGEGEDATSFLELAPAQQSALTGALVGIIIMIVAEVAIIVLKNVFCKNITAEAAQAVIDGSVVDLEPIVAEEVAVAAEDTTNE